MMLNFSFGSAKTSACLVLLAAIGWGAFGIAPVQAQNLTGAFGNNKRNTAAPVRIEANLLEVLQKKKQAIFTGNVIATRGTVRLRSARLVVHYREMRAGTSKSKTEITLLVASGNVIVTSGNKKATGQWAKMHMKTNKVTMGDKVILRENKNIIHGSKLELDLKTGKSRLLGSKNSRVLGVFVPDPVR
jgi:lipopolysaccharide export system protein LptA